MTRSIDSAISSERECIRRILQDSQDTQSNQHQEFQDRFNDLKQDISNQLEELKKKCDLSDLESTLGLIDNETKMLTSAMEEVKHSISALNSSDDSLTASLNVRRN